MTLHRDGSSHLRRAACSSPTWPRAFCHGDLRAHGTAGPARVHPGRRDGRGSDPGLRDRSASSSANPNLPYDAVDQSVVPIITTATRPVERISAAGSSGSLPDGVGDHLRRGLQYLGQPGRQRFVNSELSHHVLGRRHDPVRRRTTTASGSSRPPPALPVRRPER